MLLQEVVLDGLGSQRSPAGDVQHGRGASGGDLPRELDDCTGRWVAERTGSRLRQEADLLDWCQVQKLTVHPETETDTKNRTEKSESYS